VFLTEHKDITSVETINGACQVLSYEEFENLSEYPPNIFFSRFNIFLFLFINFIYKEHNTMLPRRNWNHHQKDGPNIAFVKSRSTQIFCMFNVTNVKNGFMLLASVSLKNR